MPIYALDGVAPQLPADGDYWIAPDAVLIGNVVLRKGASVWFGAVIRADNDLIEIGEGSNVQDNAVVHADPGLPTVIGAHVTVGHSAIVHGCTIGHHTLIGMGAIILNGAVVGNHCLVGAKALVTERKVFEDHTLIAGAPARAVRKLEGPVAEGVLRSAPGYVQNSRRFKAGLTLVRP